jgi:apolipoprotein N-acyltransferase
MAYRMDKIRVINESPPEEGLIYKKIMKKQKEIEDRIFLVFAIIMTSSIISYILYKSGNTEGSTALFLCSIVLAAFLISTSKRTVNGKCHAYIISDNEVITFTEQRAGFRKDNREMIEDLIIEDESVKLETKEKEIQLKNIDKPEIIQNEVYKL